MENVKPKIFSGFGTDVTGALTSEECIKKAELDYHVGKAPIFIGIEKTEIPSREDSAALPESTKNPDGTITSLSLSQVKDKFGTYREDTQQAFGVVGSRYHVIQNIEAFSFFDSIVGEGEAIYENAGFVGIGETIFIQAKMPDYIKVGADSVERYLTLTMSHDGTGSIKAYFTPVRIVCKNTLSVSLRECSNKITIRHTASASNKLKTAHDLMGISNKLSNELSDIFNKMADTKVDNVQVGKYLKEVFLSKDELKALADNNYSLKEGVQRKIVSTNKKNIITDVYRYTLNHKTQRTTECLNTMYGVFQGITGYAQNVKNYNNEQTKAMDILEGTMSNRIQHTFDLLVNNLI